MSLHLLATLVAVVALCATAVNAGVDPADVRKELETIEDLRLLHRHGIAELHDARALAMYLKGFKGPNRLDEVVTLFQESEGLYLRLRGADHGAAGLKAMIDAFGKDEPSTLQLALLRRARRTVAEEVNDFYARCAAMKAQLGKQVTAAATKSGLKWELISKPEPWADAHKEAARKGAWPRGWQLNNRFFNMPREQGDYQLGKAAKSGISYILMLRRGACDWGQIEGEPGEYDWTTLDETIERLAKAGMRTCPALMTLTGTPPMWVIDKYGQESGMLRVLKNKRKRRGGINLFHPPTGRAFAKFLTAYAAHLKEKFPKHIDAIYVDAQREIGAVADVSQTMNVYWRKWSKTDTLWRTPEAIAAAEPLDRAALAKAEMCRESWLVDYITRVSAALKKGWPRLPVQNYTINDDFHVITDRSALSRDYHRLAQAADNPGTRTSSAASYWILRSLGAPKRIWAYGFHSGSGLVPSADLGQLVMYDTARVAGGHIGVVTRLRYPLDWYRYPDEQLGDFGIGSYFLAARRSQQSAPVMLSTDMVKPDIAILWSQSTFRLDASFRWHNGTLAFAHMLRRAFWHFDFLPEEGFAKRLGDYKLLILPNTQCMPDALAPVIRKWVKGGGILLGFGAPGLYDELGKKRAGLPLADVFGADVARMRTPGLVRPDKLQTTHSEGSFTFDSWPRQYKYETDLTAALKVAGAKARAWYAGTANEVAIVEHAFGEGKTMLSGFPLGFEYRECARYEVDAGNTHHRHNIYNMEQNRYEKWITKELEKLGMSRAVTVPAGRMLREQRGSDPDWAHVYRNNPEYKEQMGERDRPARTIAAVARKRGGIDNIYVGLAHTEFNYMVHLGYFRSTLAGGEVTASVRLDPQAAPAKAAGKKAKSLAVVFDARLAVPVPARVSKGRLTFQTWVPSAQSSSFAVAPAGKVRLFGPGSPSGVGPDDLLERTGAYAKGDKLGEIEILATAKIDAFLKDLKELSIKKIVIGCGDLRFKAPAEAMRKWIKTAYGIDARVTMATQRAGASWHYMDSFAGPGVYPEPIVPQILIGNSQDNGLMRRFINVRQPPRVHWLPLGMNQSFPGIDRAVVALSLPVSSNTSGRVSRVKDDQQLVIGASFPSEALRAVKALAKAVKNAAQ